ncbi:MAG: GNAT family N-acetyltransferase [Patescibacteria group bacterium]
MTIETERLILKPISPEYIDDIFSNFTEEVTVHMFPQPTGKKEDTKAFVRKSMKENYEGTNMQMVVLKKDTGEFLGNAGLHDITKRDPELGIWIKRSAHGNKYGFEAIEALVKWARKNLIYDYIKYPVVKENIASRKIPEALGAKVAREFIGKNARGEPMDEVEYHIV